jgi:hypothetical protein
MIREIFEQRLDSLSFSQEQKITELSEEYRKDVSDVLSTAVRYSQMGGAQGRQALGLITNLGETAVESLASAVATRQPVPDTGLLIEMVKGVVFAEHAVTRRLKAALKDTRMVPQPAGMRALEEVGPPHRICDEAYTALRRILNSESLLQRLVESRHFLSLAEAAKNEEIESCLRTGTFTRFLEDVDAQEE